MKNILTLFISFISAFMIYALIGGAISLVFCVSYRDVVQTPSFIVFVGILSFCSSMFIAGQLNESDIL